MNPPDPLCAVYFSREKYKYDPGRKRTEVSASQTSQQGSLLLIAERKSQPGRSAHGALDAEEGGKERRRQGGEKNTPPLPPPPPTEAVHRWVGLDRLRAGCISGGLSRLQPEERLTLWGFGWS